MPFRRYLGQLCIFVLSSSLTLGLMLGISLLIAGESSMDVDLDLDFGVFDGLWLILGLPVLSIIIFTILSPLSFFVHRLLSRRAAKSVQPDEKRMR